jgi:prepilin-type N-terminal cleavage/methylation domain-containing protein
MNSVRLKVKSLQKGFSLVEVIVGLAIMAGLGLGAMRLSDYVQKTRKMIAIKRETLMLQQKVRLLLENKAACDASFAGLTFRGSAIPQLPTPAADLSPYTNPLHGIELRYPNIDGSTKAPIFSHDPNERDQNNLPINRFGPLEIKATELIMPEHTSSADFLQTVPNSETVPATIAIHSVTKFTREKELQNPVMRFRIYLSVITDASGISTILGCGVDSLSDQTIYYEAFVGNNDQVPIQTTSGKNQFYFCAFMGQLHSPAQYRTSLNAHTSETRCQLTPTGTGPLYNWTITTVAIDGTTRCEVVCL